MVTMESDVMRRALEELELFDLEVEDLDGEAARRRIKQQYRKLALRHHPDKHNSSNIKTKQAGSRKVEDGGGADGSGEEKFKRIAAAHEILLESRERRLGEQGEGFDFEEYCAGFRYEETELVRIFKQAMLGEDVEGELRSIGAHRPPSNFGLAPFPPFDATEREKEEGTAVVGKPKAASTTAMAGVFSAEEDCLERLRREVKGALGADDDATRRLERVGVKSLSLARLEGEATVLTKHRRGVEAKYLSLEVSAAFAFAVEVRPGGAYVTGVLAAVPHFSEDAEEEGEIEVLLKWPTRKAEAQGRGADTAAIRAELRTAIFGALSSAAREMVGG
uniref:J domain-containing protein n=1 Tax=Chloropicon roscoffensis TaxID=1461544 RepID=A0A7S3CB21_9CHLO|mmetsp:Transcript_3333/g.10092  ORF Transcript_3333/g.10092 Transcript_3333/m.10092 type:complete len:334 (+) Transcript_3333:171-1172(+)